MSQEKKIAELRHSAKCLRAGTGIAKAFNPEFHEDLANICDEAADRLKAGEDPFFVEEEEETPEEAAAAAETARTIRDLLRQEKVDSLGELFAPLKGELN
jgi:hypothetical protein